MAGSGKGGSKGGSNGQASNADLQDDEDKLNRIYRGNYFRDWAKKRKEKTQRGPLIFYDKSPAPPKK